MGNFLREAGRGILLLDLRIFLADLFGGLVFLVEEFELVACHEIIEDIRADEVRARQMDLAENVRGRVLQDLVRQQHTGGLAPDFSGANAALQDHVEIGGRKPAPGDVNKGQLVAYQAFEQDDDKLLEVVIHRGALLVRQGFVFFSLSQDHLQGGKLRVEGQAVVRRDAPAVGLRRPQQVQDLIEDLNRQIVGEVEIGQGAAYPTPAQLPLLWILVLETVQDPFALLGLDGLFLHLGIEALGCNDPTAK